MATTLEDLLDRATRSGVAARHSADAVDWFRKRSRRVSVTDALLMKEERENLVNSWTNTGPGRMYFVYYDPKHKETLPYYDSFPLMIPIERYKDGLLGLNLHYLPPVLRAKLLDKLLETVNNDKMDVTTKMKVSYGIMKDASKYAPFKPCIKRYLGKHFRSRFLRVPPEAWAPAVFLPVERFQKAKTTQVWADSRKIIRG